MYNDGLAQKMMKYSIDEIRMAENYIRLAKGVEDANMSMKLQEIAKDELRHYDVVIGFLNNHLSKEAKGSEIKAELLENVYSEWISGVKSTVDEFKAK